MHTRVAQVLNPVAYKKSKIPKALREQVWIAHVGEKFKTKCKVTWCKNRINVFDFQCGHNVPESKGGKTNILNLIPICSRCNLSMGDQFSIDEWNVTYDSPKNISWWIKLLNIKRRVK